jgi:NTP pyrophosphatase (non-canonical NTP hydrolase)
MSDEVEPKFDLYEIQQQMKEDSDRWFGPGTSENMTLMVLGICGESGEVADIVKKVMRGSLTIEEATPKLKEEMIDVFHYWLMVAGMLGMDIGMEYEKKRIVNEARFATWQGDTSNGLERYESD